MCEIYDDGERADVYNQTSRRARKPHRCEGCGAVILPGETYRYGSGVHDRRGFSERACLDCAKVCQDFGKAHGYWPSFDRLQEMLHECIAEGDPESLGWKVHLDAMKERSQNYQAQRLVTKAFVGWLTGDPQGGVAHPWIDPDA